MSEKRPDKTFIASLVTHPSTRYILFRDLCPLFSPQQKNQPAQLAYHSYSDVSSIVDPEARKGNQWCFLGVDRDDLVVLEDGKELGRPYFCLDVTPLAGEEGEAECRKIIKGVEFIIGSCDFVSRALG